MKCQAKVKSKGMNFFRERQCKNNAIDGLTYCHIHSPQALVDRMKKGIKTNKKKDALRKSLYYTKLKNNNP